MCNPSWSPEKAAREFCTHVDVDSVPAIWFLYGEKYLFDLGVEASWMSAFNTLQTFDSRDSSSGPGFALSYKSRNDFFVPGLCDEELDPFHLLIKEEVSKAEKVDKGDYRVICNCCSKLVFGLKQYCYCFNKSLTEKGVTIKGDDLRPTIHRIINLDKAYISDGWYVYQGDASVFDRSITSLSLRQIYLLRNKFLSLSGVDYIPQNLVDAVCSFEFTWFDPVSKTLNKENSVRGNPSGQPNTTEDETLLLLCMLLGYSKTLYPDLENSEFKFIGTGDDWNLIIKRPLQVDGIIDMFKQYGITMKCWSLNDDINKFDLMGATIGRNGFPCWNMKRMLVHDLYMKKSTTDEDICLMLISQYEYLVYHPLSQDFFSLVIHILRTLCSEKQFNKHYLHLKMAYRFYISS